jgi:hypothetical protein
MILWLHKMILWLHKIIDDGLFIINDSMISSQVYLQQNKKKAEAKGKNCHAKPMWSLDFMAFFFLLSSEQVKGKIS